MSTTAKAFLTDTQSARMENITRATLSMIRDIGAERMTMRNIAAASQVSAATLYNHFGTKDNLVTFAVVANFEQSIQAVVAAHASGKSPLQKIIYGLDVLTKEMLQEKEFAHALIGNYFKLDSNRQMPDHLFNAVRNTWQPSIDEMQKKRSLRDWVSTTWVTDEISDQVFAVVVRWAQHTFPDSELGRRLKLPILSVLMSASRGKQADEAENMLSKLSVKPFKRATKA